MSNALLTSMPADTAAALRIAAGWLQSAGTVIVTAGAGMSVDSGLPDFRGPEGFWRAYPLFRDKGYRFEDMSNPTWFEKDPKVAWGFFGHRLNLYRAAVPHNGYHVLRRWESELGKEVQVFTSNVDGAFATVGFHPDHNIVECHGTISRLQCTDGECAQRHGAYPTPQDLTIRMDMATLEANLDDAPRCAACGALARPNILMFGDGECNMDIVMKQEERFDGFVDRVADASAERGEGSNDPVTTVIIEIGAGTYVPTVRNQSEYLCRKIEGSRLIRVNPREPEVPQFLEKASVSLSLGGKAAIEALDALIREVPSTSPVL